MVTGKKRTPPVVALEDFEIELAAARIAGASSKVTPKPELDVLALAFNVRVVVFAPAAIVVVSGSATADALVQMASLVFGVSEEVSTYLGYV